MDLHVVGPAASPDERSAIDRLLDPLLGASPGTRDGGDQPDRDGQVARGGHDARARRHLLLPALEAVQARFGWISRGSLNHVCRRLAVPPAEAYGVATFYALLATTPAPPAIAHACDDIACRLAGAEPLCASLEAALGPAVGGDRADGDGSLGWKRSPCLGLCDLAPAALVTIAGREPHARAIGAADATAILAELRDGRATSDPRSGRPIPQAGDSSLRLLARVGRVDPTSLEAYRAAGGYRALERAFDLGPAGVVDEITAARLVGRGGAAFPAGRKWAAVAAQPVTERYVVCNADESEPGTFKDRVLLEEDPFAIVEALTIAGFATGAGRGYVYLRGEYPLARERLEGALRAARDAGLLGPAVAGRDWAFDIELRIGAGAYICGEETALFESIEGRRGEPRNKPPFPVEAGLFGRPTAINNVETLANVPLILEHGAAAYAAVGTEGSTGPKLFCLSGHVTRPGVYEVPFGPTLGTLIELAGGVPGGRRIQAILLGGAAGVFVGPDAVDLPLTFEATRAAGATLGSGVIMVFDETADLPDTLRRIAAFFRDESCGQCVPCRVGSVRQEELLARLVGGRSPAGPAADLALLGELGQVMRDASICGLGQTASSAIESAIRAGLVRFSGVPA